jgi:hypothetical protein
MVAGKNTKTWLCFYEFHSVFGYIARVVGYAEHDTAFNGTYNAFLGMNASEGGKEH